MSEKESWLEQLEQVVQKRRLAVLQFDGEKWERIIEHGKNSFSFTLPYEVLQDLRTPTACLILAGGRQGKQSMHLGVVISRGRITTLDSRINIKSVHPIAPQRKEQLMALVTTKPFSTYLNNYFNQQTPSVCLSAKLSAHLVNRLAEIEENNHVMRRLSRELKKPRTHSINSNLQEDAIHTALRAFGIKPHDEAFLRETMGQTTLDRVNIHEDSVIEHDSRFIPQFDLNESDLTGRAVFEKGRERLEVVTANRRPLEEVLGVDLIYLNAIKQNVVMVQYKMLEPSEDEKQKDWIYRPDSQLEKQIIRMKRFSCAQPPEPFEYRINSQMFYLKFIKRNASLGKSPILMPVEHFEALRKNPDCLGPRGAFRISFESLAGRYLRQEPFFHLLRSGYIGAHAETASNLTNLIEVILQNGRGVVAALQTNRTSVDSHA